MYFLFILYPNRNYLHVVKCQIYYPIWTVLGKNVLKHSYNSKTNLKQKNTRKWHMEKVIQFLIHCSSAILQ